MKQEKLRNSIPHKTRILILSFGIGTSDLARLLFTYKFSDITIVKRPKDKGNEEDLKEEEDELFGLRKVHQYTLHSFVDLNKIITTDFDIIILPETQRSLFNTKEHKNIVRLVIRAKNGRINFSVIEPVSFLGWFISY